MNSTEVVCSNVRPPRGDPALLDLLKVAKDRATQAHQKKAATCDVTRTCQNDSEAATSYATQTHQNESEDRKNCAPQVFQKGSAKHGQRDAWDNIVPCDDEVPEDWEALEDVAKNCAMEQCQNNFAEYGQEDAVGNRVPFDLKVHVCAEDWGEFPPFVLEGVTYIQRDGHLTTGKDLRALVASIINEHTELMDPRQMRLIVHRPLGLTSDTPLSNSASLIAVRDVKGCEIRVIRKRRGKKGAGNGFKKGALRKQLSHFHVKIRGDFRVEADAWEFRYQSLLSLLRLHAADALVLCSSSKLAVDMKQRLSEAGLNQRIAVAGAEFNERGECRWPEKVLSSAHAAQVVIAYDELHGVPSFSNALQHTKANTIMHHLTMRSQAPWQPLVMRLKDLGCEVSEIEAKQLLGIDRQFALWYYGHGVSLALASKEMKNDREVVLAAISHGASLEGVSEELLGDRTIVLTALAHGHSFRNFATHDIKKEVVDVRARYNISLAESANAILHEKVVQLEVLSKETSITVGCYSIAGNELTRFSFMPESGERIADGSSYLLEQLTSRLSLHDASLQRVVLPAGLLLSHAEEATPLELLEHGIKCNRTECLRCGCATEYDEYGDRICWCDSCRIDGCKPSTEVRTVRSTRP